MPAPLEFKHTEGGSLLREFHEPRLESGPVDADALTGLCPKGCEANAILETNPYTV